MYQAQEQGIRPDAMDQSNTNHEQTERSWSDLQCDLLSLIRSRLLGKDFVCFTAVCRTWRRAPLPIRSIHATMFENIDYPSLLYFRGHGSSSTCNVYDPLYDTTYLLDNPDVIGAQILFSKYGWLLMSRGLHIFFFQPYTKQRIDLPDIYLRFPENFVPFHLSFNRMCFSAPPTSPDCVVFGIVDMYEKSVHISFIRHGEDSWTSLFDCVNKKRLNMPSCNLDYCTTSFQSSYSNPVFRNGAFYCLSGDGKLGVFDPRRKGDARWTVLDRPEQPCESIRDNFLVECNGDLVSVCVGRVGEYVKVFKLNRLGTAWQEVDSIEDWMLMVSHTTSISIPCRSLKLQGMENKIFFPRFNGMDSVFYSLDTCSFHSFRNGYTGEDFHNTKEHLHCTWIEPNFQLFSVDELNWHAYTEPEYQALEFFNSKTFFDTDIQDLSCSYNSMCTSGNTGTIVYEKQLTPWLIFSHGKCGETQTFFDISERRLHERNIPELRQNYIGTCAYGWIVLIDYNYCYLLNPTSMEKIKLPAWKKLFSYDECVLSAPPDDPSCIVMFIFNFEDEKGEESVKVHFCRVGDIKWTVRSTKLEPETGGIASVIGHKGMIYGLTRSWGKFVTIEYFPTLAIRKVAEGLPKSGLRGTWRRDQSLVESYGELFGLAKWKFGAIGSEIVQDIQVYKMDFTTMLWERTENIGDLAFFWGLSSSTSCSARKSGFKGNAIYYIEPEDRSLYSFDLEDASISASIPCPDSESWSEAALITCLV